MAQTLGNEVSLLTLDQNIFIGRHQFVISLVLFLYAQSTFASTSGSHDFIVCL